MQYFNSKLWISLHVGQIYEVRNK